MKPKVGQIIRVVLEGEVTCSEDYALWIESTNDNDIQLHCLMTRIVGVKYEVIGDSNEVY